MTRTTYTLKHPVTVDGQEYYELSLRRPKTRDLLKARKSRTSWNRPPTCWSIWPKCRPR